MSNSSGNSGLICPLCCDGGTRFYFQDAAREYRKCVQCRLVFVPSRYWIGREEERAVYDLHENDPLDPGYRKFLSRLTVPLLRRLPLSSGQSGLDFGCGPGPALAVLLKEKGCRVDLYDPFYHDDPSVFGKSYDFICATEVVEHLRVPDQDFSTLFRLLKPGGWLAIMTKLVIDQEAFSRWHYIRDLTHICFYRRFTFEYLARHYGADLDFVQDDVIFFKKQTCVDG